MPKLSRMRSMILYTSLMIIVLIITIAGIIRYMYRYSESEAMEHLRLETVKFKNNINIQMNSDAETLRSMAGLVSERYTDENSYLHVCKTFEAFGFCENIGILVPDNRLITKHGVIDVNGKIDFAEEAKRGEYISGRVKDLTNDKKQAIRTAMPIKSADGEVVAIMYGTFTPDRFANRYKAQLKSSGAYMAIIEGETGQFIVDTKNDGVSNITNLAGIMYDTGYTYDKFFADMSDGKSGYTAFNAKNSKEMLYVRYGSLDISDWRIILAQPETVVFDSARATIVFLMSTSALILLIMFVYILCMLYSVKKMLKINSFAADIRKSLLELNQRSESLDDALRGLTEFSRSRSAFVIDAYNEERHYILPSRKHEELSADDIYYFNKKMLLYAARHRENHGASVYVSQLVCDDELRREMAELYDFMLFHNIACVRYAVIINNNSNIYMLGVVNPKNKAVSDLLKKIAVCFSMAVYNNKHLMRTEKMALTDSLTGIANRMAFKQEVRELDLSGDDVACIYVDVNELHFFNNKHGHSAGDQMLRFIAESLSNQFIDSHIYRMGGDEFLILCTGIEIDEINKRLAIATAEIEEMKYHIAVGVRYGKIKTTFEEMVNEAERIMYENKAKYYQDKELGKVTTLSKRNTVTFETGVKAIDACLSVMSLKYFAVYCVSFDNDKCIRILAPSYYADYMDENNLYSASLKRYFYEFVKPEYHRILLSFLDYDSLKKSLNSGNIPTATYERIDGERVILKVYPISESDGEMDAVWIFENADM